MTLLSPLGLLGLASIPVLLWLWRLVSTHRHIRVSSLVPFEHLLKRSAKRRTHLVVNALFWLQLAALLGLALALAQPVIFVRHARTVFVVLDTSASMGARLRGPSAFDQAQHILRSRISHKAPADQFFIMTTSPVRALVTQPMSDAVALTNLLRDLRANHVGGNLATTVRIGRLLLATEPDETLVITDEAQPAGSLGVGVRWVRVGAWLPNVAIVGLDAEGPLCSPAEARIIATIQNFSNESAAVSVSARQGTHQLAQDRAELAPQTRWSLPLALPQDTHGLVEVVLTSERDSLEVDNRAWIEPHRTSALPVIVHSKTPTFTRTISTWLSACQALTRATEIPSGQHPFLVITDKEQDVLPAATAVMLFLPPSSPRPLLSQWTVSADHPIGSYLAPVDVVAASLNLWPGAGSGLPVVSAVVDGQKVPVVMADERDERRIVTMYLDPAGSDGSTPILLAFFNSLRWLMGERASVTTGDPLTLNAFRPGAVRVDRPDGSTETADSDGGVFHYNATTLAGRYRFTQGSAEVNIAVNFLDPLESNTLNRVSTWRPLSTSPAGRGQSLRAPYPIANLLIAIILLLLLTEWWMYAANTRPTQGQFPKAGGSGSRATTPSPPGPPSTTAGAGEPRAPSVLVR